MKNIKFIQLTIALLFALSVLVVPVKAVFAAETGEATTTKITINKRIWTDKAPDNIQNTGEVMDFGGSPLNGSEFTVYDITDKYYDLLVGSTQKAVIAQIQSEASQNAPSYATKVDSKVTTGQGQAAFENLPVKNSSNKYNVYLFLETKTPNEVTVTKRSAPIVLALPIYKLDANQKPTDIVNTDIQLYPKNETATDTKEFTNVGSFEQVTVGDKTFANVSTGDVLNYKLTVNMPANIGDSNAVTSFKVYDKPSAGLALVGQTVKVGDLTPVSDYTIQYADGGFTVDFNLTSAKVKALAGQKLQIVYDMKLIAEVNVDELQNNKASVQINNGPKQEITPPTPVGTGGYKFVKKDAQTGKNLARAEFVVANKDQTKFIKFADQKNAKGEYVFYSWVNNKAQASSVVSDDSGSVKIIGLVNGDYVLNEIKAPSSDYVLLKDGTVKFTVENGKYATSQLEVKNTLKGLLPATGGSGAYLFLVVGGAMMLTAFLWLKKTKQRG